MGSRCTPPSRACMCPLPLRAIQHNRCAARHPLCSAAASAADCRPLRAADLPADCWAAIAEQLVDEWEEEEEDIDADSWLDEQRLPRRHQPDK